MNFELLNKCCDVVHSSITSKQIASAWFISSMVLCCIAGYLLDRFYYPKMFARRAKRENRELNISDHWMYDE